MYTNTIVKTGELPAIALKNVVPLPNNEIRIDVGRSKSIEAIKAAAASDKYVALFVQRNPMTDDITPEGIFKCGIIAKVVYHLDGNIHKVKLSGITRCILQEMIQEEPYWIASVSTRPSFGGNVDEEMNYVKMLISEIEKNGPRLLNGNKEVINLISSGITADKLTDVLAYHLHFDLKSKMKYVDNPSISDRLRYLVEDIKRENQFVELDNKIEEEVRKSINESQKEYYLREKMKAIKT